jgi:hypothetical protein
MRVPPGVQAVFAAASGTGVFCGLAGGALSCASHASCPIRATKSRDNLLITSLGMWILLLLPFIGLLWVPFYNDTLPELFGFPFFYWYQLLWVPITAFLTWIVYRSQRHEGDE